MSGRAEPFATALTTLRERLVRGAYPVEARLAATELAAELRLSATPVREALSRLAGEGLIEDRRGQGFFVRRLGRRDIAGLYRLSLSHLSLALGGEAPVAEMRDHGCGKDPVEVVERLFLAWVGTAGARVLVQSFARIQAQLGPVRRLEPRLLPDLGQEAESLLSAADRSERFARVRRFHMRRVRLAERLADLLDAGPANSPDIV